MNTLLASKNAADDCSRVELTDRRRHPRYRYSAPLAAHLPDGTLLRAITLEISESGLSALISTSLNSGERVELEPVGGGRAVAVVRRSQGKVCSFEFLDLSAEQTQSIRERCKRLPLFKHGPLGI